MSTEKQSVAYKQVGDNLTIKLDGKVYTLTGGDSAYLVSLIKLYNKHNREADLLRLKQEIKKSTAKPVKPDVIKKRQQKKQLKKKIVEAIQAEKPAVKSEYQDLPGIHVEEGIARLEGLRFALPEDFLGYLKSWIEADEDPQPLINFMYNLAANPSNDVRQRMFTFLAKKRFMVTPDGYLVTARYVHIHQKGTDADLHTFAQKAYVQVRLKKKATQDFSIYQTESGELAWEKTTRLPNEAKSLGTVKELKEAPGEATVYTDGYTKSFRIKLGEWVTMKAEDADFSNASCSRGLHQTSLWGLSEYSSNGPIILLCLVRPQDVISIPYETKFRSLGYLPIAELTDQDVDELKENQYRVLDDETSRAKASREQVSILKNVRFVQDNDNRSKGLKAKLKALQKADHLSQAEQDFLAKRIVTI